MPHRIELRDIKQLELWLALVRRRDVVIGKTRWAASGEEFMTCGDIELDSLIAGILLDKDRVTMSESTSISEDGRLVQRKYVRNPQGERIPLRPARLFSINWSYSGPGISWPETYSVIDVRELNVRFVTASADSDEIWGYTDLAIGWCRPVGSPIFGVKKIIQCWWERSGGAEHMPREEFCDAGLVGQEQAERWRRELYGSKSRDDI